MPSSALTLLGLETSCDETAAAVMRGEGVLLSSVLYSQHDVHRRYGGVVPELAARRHIETVEAVVAEAMAQANIQWSDLHAVAVTSGPGLAGALLVGVSVAKALAYARGIPLIAVNHLEGHIASAWMENPDLPRPCMILVVSGGHTHLYLSSSMGAYQLVGHTLDDAAGEAFDKGAKMLGLDFPGGPALDRLAQSGNPAAVSFPRPYLQNNNLDFSFSGIKTALLYYLRDLDRAGSPRPVADIAASYQEAIVEVLVEKSGGCGATISDSGPCSGRRGLSEFTAAHTPGCPDCQDRYPIGDSTGSVLHRQRGDDCCCGTARLFGRYVGELGVGSRPRVVVADDPFTDHRPISQAQKSYEDIICVRHGTEALRFQLSLGIFMV